MTVGIAGTFMISFAGDAAVSGVSLVNMVVTMFIYIFTALAAGGAVVVSQYIGNGNRADADRSAGQLLIQINKNGQAVPERTVPITSSGFDMPLLIDVPLTEAQIPRLDAILLTHCDNDHYSRTTCKKLAPVVSEFHATHYVASLLKEELEIDGAGHGIGEMNCAAGSSTRSVWPPSIRGNRTA